MLRKTSFCIIIRLCYRKYRKTERIVSQLTKLSDIVLKCNKLFQKINSSHSSLNLIYQLNVVFRHLPKELKNIYLRTFFVQDLKLLHLAKIDC